MLGSDTWVLDEKDTRMNGVRISTRTHTILKELVAFALQWRHNLRYGVSNHRPHHCLLNRLFRLKSTKISKLHVTGLCAGNSSVTGEFPAKRASDPENVSIWWRHHYMMLLVVRSVSVNAVSFRSHESLIYSGTRQYFSRTEFCIRMAHLTGKL